MWAFHEHQVVRIAREAGTDIMGRLADVPTLQVMIKPDGSRVTDADLAAHAIIMQLGEAEIGGNSVGKVLTPGIPVLSEEMPKEQQLAVMKTGTYWCVDPLDGTDTAIRYANGNKSHDGFGVLIALVKDGEPVFGVAHFPAQGRIEDGKPVGATYFTSANGRRAYRQEGSDPRQHLRVGPFRPLNECRVVRSYKDKGECVVAGHTMKSFSGAGGGRFLRVAEGKAELAHMAFYPAIWDVGAVAPILRAAGAEMVALPPGGALGSPQTLANAQRLKFDGTHAPEVHGPLYLRSALAAAPDMLRVLGARNLAGRAPVQGA